MCAAQKPRQAGAAIARQPGIRPPLHPVRPRCFSVEYHRHAPASRPGAVRSVAHRDSGHPPPDRDTSRYNRRIGCRTAEIGVGAAKPAFGRSSELQGGRHGFDGDRRTPDACRAPSTRKSDGTHHNCEHAARSRRLNRRRRPSHLRLRGGNGRHSAGWPRPAASTGRSEIYRRSAAGGFGRAFTPVVKHQARTCM